MRSSSARKLDSYQAVSQTGGSSWYGVAAVALAAALFLLRLGARALWASEGRWAEIVREMLLSSNYFWPTINGTVYFDKPLLSYWFILGATHLTGGLNETAARLPSAISGVAGVVLIIMLGRRLYDRTTGVWAGIILATSFSYVFYSRTASADIETTAGVLAALLLFVCNRQRPNGWWVVGLWLVMALTSLTKGLMGFALPPFILGLYSLLGEGAGKAYQRLASGPAGARWSWIRQRFDWLLNFKTPIAIIAAGTVYLAPFAISQSRAHSDAGLYMVFRENVVRFFAPFDHRGPVYLYLYVLFALMVPWSAFIPAALLQMHRQARSAAQRALADADVFALSYFWGTLLFFTLSRSRRSYYLLPILPASALVVGRLFAQRAESLWAPARRLVNLGYALLSVGAIGVGIAFLMPAAMRPGWFSLLPPSPARLIFAGGWLIVLATILYAWQRPTVRTMGVSTVVMAYLGMFFLFIIAMPRAETYRHERSFARAVRTNVATHPSRLAFFRIWGPGLVYYLSMERPIPLFNTTEQVASFAHREGGAWVITRAKDAQDLKMDKQIRAGEPRDPWDPPSEQGNRYVLVKID